VEYDKARRLAGPRHAALWVITDKLGQVLVAVGRKQEAKALFRVSLDMHPDDLEAHFHLGRLLADEDPWQAFLHLREATRLNPLDPRVHRHLAAVCLRLAEEKDSRQDFVGLAAHHRMAFRVVSQLNPSPRQPAKTEGAGQVEKTARLRIVTRPWARVWLDFADTGLTTPVFDLPVAPGRHVVSLAADCRGEPEVLWVRAIAGQTEVIDLELCSARPPESEAPAADPPAGLPVAR
jgi:tetratricopeptide (TPR) repeat protein